MVTNVNGVVTIKDICSDQSVIGTKRAAEEILRITPAMIGAAGAILAEELDLSRGIAASVEEDSLLPAFRVKSASEPGK